MIDEFLGHISLSLSLSIITSHLHHLSTSPTVVFFVLLCSFKSSHIFISNRSKIYKTDSYLSAVRSWKKINSWLIVFTCGFNNLFKKNDPILIFQTFIVTFSLTGFASLSLVLFETTATLTDIGHRKFLKFFLFQVSRTRLGHETNKNK